MTKKSKKYPVTAEGVASCIKEEAAFFAGKLTAVFLRGQTQKELRKSLRQVRMAKASLLKAEAVLDYQLDVRNDMSRAAMLKR